MRYIREKYYLKRAAVPIIASSVQINNQSLYLSAYWASKPTVHPKISRI
jgi:hypothetical protein